MKAWKKGLTILLAVLMMTALAVTAFADDPTPPPSTSPAATPTPKPGENQYEGNKHDETLKEVTGDATKPFEFDKYLVLRKNADVPNVKFRFTIEPGPAGNAANASSDSVFIKPEQRVISSASNGANKGNVKGNPVFVADATVGVTAATNIPSTSDLSVAYAILTYTPEAATTLESDTVAREGKTIYFMTEAKNTDEKYAQKTMKIDFSGVTFYEPGVYRYTIREDQSYTDTYTKLFALQFDPKAAEPKVRYLDVYVIDVDGELTIQSYVLHELGKAPSIDTAGDKGTNDVTADGDKLNDKSTGFSNWYDTVDLEIKKEVSGNQASRDKFFKITIKVNADNMDPTSYEVVTSNMTLRPTQNAATYYTTNQMAVNSTNLTQAANGKYWISAGKLRAAGGAVFYLQHGDTIRIKGLPAQYEYEVDEVEEDYKRENAGVTDYKNAISGKLSEVDEKMRADGSATDPDPDSVVYTSFKNTRNGTIPTGILTVVGPAVAVIALGAVGMGIVLVGKRRREEEEEA